MGVAEKKEEDFDFSEKLHTLNEELERQINSLLFERLALSKDREKVLEFYNYVLKCFVLIDLKDCTLTHLDIGQMDFYVRYFEKEERLVGDNPSIGVILCSDKNETMVRYTLLEDSKRIF